MKAKFERFHVYFANEKEKHLLEKFMFGVESGKPGVENGKLNADVAGMAPSWIAEKSGFKVPSDTSIIAVELKKLARKSPYREKNSRPSLASTRSKDPKKVLRMPRRCWNSAGLATPRRSIAKSRAWPMPLATKSKPFVSFGIRRAPSVA
jgi:acetaldehyde dehydrogenase/alcohol dehydrogenase